MNKIILASNSERRAKLLELAELQFIVMPSYAPEEFDPTDSPEEIVKQLAERKARATFEKAMKRENAFIIGADTMVVSEEGEILNKPYNYEEAFEMLRKISGKSHKVITGICILTSREKITFSETTLVRFTNLTDRMIDYYLQKHEPYDKAGSYAIQEWIGAVGITGIEGDYYNVMGLPVHRLICELEKLDYPLPYSI